MSLSKLLFRVVLVFACAALLAGSALAQFRASIQGTVMDSNGGAIAGAKVTVTNQGTGATRETVASAEGFYRIGGLPPGLYTVTIEAAGFKKSTSNDVAVEAATPRGLDVTLEVGAVSEQATVASFAEALTTEKATRDRPLPPKKLLVCRRWGATPMN